MNSASIPPTAPIKRQPTHLKDTIDAALFIGLWLFVGWVLGKIM